MVVQPRLERRIPIKQQPKTVNPDLGVIMRIRILLRSPIKTRLAERQVVRNRRRTAIALALLSRVAHAAHKSPPAHVSSLTAA